MPGKAYLKLEKVSKDIENEECVATFPCVTQTTSLGKLAWYCPIFTRGPGAGGRAGV